MRRFLKENGFTVFFLGIFLAAVSFQGLVGWHDFNNDQLHHGGQPVSLGRYLVSSEFGVALLENWRSEYLQFTLYILGTVWLLQRGSPESKELGTGGPSPTSASGWVDYVRSADSWEVAVYLRQRGSPESKPVGAPHDATGATG